MLSWNLGPSDLQSCFICHLYSLLSLLHVHGIYLLKCFPSWGPMYIQRCHKKIIYQNQKSMFLYIYMYCTIFEPHSIFFQCFSTMCIFLWKKKKEREFEKNCQIRLGTSTLNSKQILKCLLGYISSTTKNVHLWLPKPTKEWHRCFT